ncbi:beta-ketoacyl synthase [Nocardia alba]|uniref:FabA-like protein n=1 Tax=Nocardia alba TaxID=225051 RepID=A0A4R1FNT5_9NOCA|nr:beta-ketoacyl synthase [Nocardia alba]TCJ95019.1 FabA-like protein [Nocardia alba]
MTTTPLDALDFDGEPFDVLAWSLALEPATSPATPATGSAVAAVRDTTAPAPTASSLPATVRAAAAGPPADAISALLHEVRSELVTAHLSAMDVQTALQRRALASLRRDEQLTRTDTEIAPASPTWAEQSFAVMVDYAPATGLAVSAAPGHPVVSELPPPATTMNAFKFLARTPITALNGTDLAALGRGEVAAVFGPAYDQEGVNPDIRLTEGTHADLTEVLELAGREGPWARGRLRAIGRVDGPDPVTAATELTWQAAQVFAVRAGLQLCLAGARFQAGEPFEVTVSAPLTGPVELVADVVQIDLLPRPWIRVNAEIRCAGKVVARVHGLTVEVVEEPGLPIGPEVGGEIPRFLGRRNVFGQRALLGEFHMTHSARGDLGIALGPEFSAYAGRRATRMPNHGLQLCDRVMAVDGRRGQLDAGSSHTEYDSPADSWYYLESADASMPNVVYMETSLQSALLLGYFLGATLTSPTEDFSLRNLDGSATVLREVDLRDKTIQQTSRLTDTTVLLGVVLQTFSYELSVDGEPFYAGQSLFGFFNAPALANQNGLDNGELVPTWLDSQEQRPAVRVIDVAARRAAGTGMPCAVGHLAMLDRIETVDGAGTYGLGYLRATRPVAADDWFFSYHFYLDPVMPGSLGVEAVIQAMQEWTVDSGLAAELVAPEFVLPVGVSLSWRYRGQILASDELMTLEVHIKSVERRPGRIRVIADASVWKPTMRIYELIDVAVELRDVGARPW